MKIIIDISKEKYETYKLMSKYYNGYEAIDDIASGIPYEEETTEWIDDGFCGDFRCISCGNEFESDLPNMRGFDFEIPNYCPNCGKKIRGLKHEIME